MDGNPLRMKSSIESQLIERYRTVWAQAEAGLGDAWVKVRPAVPFVGSTYGANGIPVLVYGSAENLNFDFRADQMGHTRNREQFDAWNAREPREWFPQLHMTPVSDGSLPTAARYMLDAAGYGGFDDLPEIFIQQIAIGNYGKFSLKGTNKDYASNPRLLQQSDDYVLADLEALRPHVVMLPRTIHVHSLHRLLKRSQHRPKTVLLIYQTNPGVINRHIERQLRSSSLHETLPRAGWVAEWLNHVPARIKMNRYLDWIDWHIKGIGVTRPSWQMQVSIT